ncbi:MAG: hypothetical protein H0V11_07085 [Actinobacteria bacterium]|nr:hypothetical protein [Actinomycetota bacterium]
MGVYTRKLQLILLRNLVTGEERVLDRMQNRKGLLSARQVSGNYASGHGAPRIRAAKSARHELATRVTTNLPVPTGKVVYSPSVNTDGTTYYVRSTPLAGDSKVLLALPNGYDADVTYATLRPPRGPTPPVTDIYFDRGRCGQNRWDIFRVEDRGGPPPVP